MTDAQMIRMENGQYVSLMSVVGGFTIKAIKFGKLSKSADVSMRTLLSGTK